MSLKSLGMKEFHDRIELATGLRRFEALWLIRAAIFALFRYLLPAPNAGVTGLRWSDGRSTDRRCAVAIALSVQSWRSPRTPNPGRC